MSGMETRGERLARNSARAYKAAHWITEPRERDGKLDVLDSGRYYVPESERAEMPKRESFVPVPELPPADLVTREDWLAWGAVAVFTVIILGVLLLVQVMGGAR